MANKQNIHKTFFALATVSQLGLSILVPVALCIIAAGWLRSKFSLGSWIMIIGILAGIGSGICSMISFIKTVQKRIHEEKQEDE